MSMCDRRAYKLCAIKEPTKEKTKTIGIQKRKWVVWDLPKDNKL